MVLACHWIASFQLGDGRPCASNGSYILDMCYASFINNPKPPRQSGYQITLGFQRTQRLDEPGAHGARIEHGLRGGEGLGDDHHLRMERTRAKALRTL